MIIGTPKEIKAHENRVALTPHVALELTSSGHEVLIEENAGISTGFRDRDYQEVGCKIVKLPKEIFDNSEMVVKVKEPQPEEVDMCHQGTTMFTYFHFAADESLTQGFLNSGATAIAYETIMLSDNSLPLLIPMSEVAGRMSVQEGAKYLEKFHGGLGKLLGGVPGVEPARVTILGGGIVGTNAAHIASGLGANVNILDVNLNRLRYLDEIMPKNVRTIYSNQYNIQELLPRTDLLIGAVLIPGAKAPNLVTRDMLGEMQEGTVVVDVAVDQGGCIETCRPTTHENPIYEVDGIIHYCVANMPGAVPFTSTTALTNATNPYVQKLANQGILNALKSDEGLLKGLNVYQGQITHQGVSDAFDMKFTSPDKAIA
ncbi:MAG: alanine dehydrogenase [Candidatus Marinimicrobia bacterium]|nr:alanine dehydrogenase [Candidatus Neomarinimicrobiota bacterium]MBL7010101.1 alanine dehydrogenase [Candidatus Neomarinimicrobiota bacterium]MBL7029988.1 alanine dehydrogenase [Candidatus Neomarinimicrobiota bacterium]